MVKAEVNKQAHLTEENEHVIAVSYPVSQERTIGTDKKINKAAVIASVQPF